MVNTRRSRGRPSASKPPKACRSLTDAMHRASVKAGIEYLPSIPINNTNHYCVGNDLSVQDSQVSFAASNTPAALPSPSESQQIGTGDEYRQTYIVIPRKTAERVWYRMDFPLPVPEIHNILHSFLQFFFCIMATPTRC